LITALQQLPDRVERVMLVGHNPTMEETAAELLSARTAEGWDEDIDIRIPTAGLLCLETDVVSWADFEPGEATLRWYLIPKLVKVLR
jgi:phosphohistidine phosphatase